jgi:two-component system KDP operon response regulator KdpE
MTAVLVADPDRSTLRPTVIALRLAGYTVETTTASARTAAKLRRRRLDALIVDPADAGAVSALRAQTDIPILVVSTSAYESNKVAMLDAGADDYLTKPYGVEELLARLRASLRRVTRSGGSDGVDDVVFTTTDFTVDLRDRRWLQRDGTEVRLTPTEWRLIEMLVRRAGHLVTQAELLEGVWGPKAISKNHYLRVQLAAIRRKVEPDPARPRYFITAPGLGLRFEPDHHEGCHPEFAP